MPHSLRNIRKHDKIKIVTVTRLFPDVFFLGGGGGQNYILIILMNVSLNVSKIQEIILRVDVWRRGHGGPHFGWYIKNLQYFLDLCTMHL